MTASFRRRSIVQGAAWAMPVVTVATVAPAYAASCSCSGVNGASGSVYINTYSQPTGLWTSGHEALVIAGSTQIGTGDFTCQGIQVPNGNNNGSGPNPSNATTGAGVYLQGDIQLTDPIFELNIEASGPAIGVQRDVSAGSPGNYRPVGNRTGNVSNGGGAAKEGTWAVTKNESDDTNLKRTYQNVTIRIEKKGTIDGTAEWPGFYTKGISEYQVTGFNNITVRLCLVGGTWSSGQSGECSSADISECLEQNGQFNMCTECSYTIKG